MTTVLTIAGSDPSGGAGLQADLRVFAGLGVHGAAVVTALTAQDTERVHEVWPCPAEWVRRQLEVVLDDVAPGAVKIGMLGTAEVVEAVAEVLAARPGVPLVLDPVWQAGGGGTLLVDAGLTALRAQLLPLTTLLTPNLAEAEQLTGSRVTNVEEMERAARALATLGPAAVLVKGGHLSGDPVDVLYAQGKVVELRGERVPLARRAHGTGCALSAATAVFLARGHPLGEAVAAGRAYVVAGLRGAYACGRGALLLDHAAGAHAALRLE